MKILSKQFFSRYGKGLIFVSCLFFFFYSLGRWSLDSSQPRFPNKNTPLIFYANQIGSNFQLLFCEALSQAQQSIFLEMYAITDPTILRFIEAKAKQGIAITIFTDRKASPGLKQKLPSSVKILTHKGRGLMHRKVLVIDHEQIFLGSVNFTTPSLTLHDNFALAIADPKIALFFENPQTHTESLFTLDKQTIEAWKLPKNGRLARKKILDELQKAQHSIHVAMFTLTDPELTEALVAAHKRGVHVALAIDYYTAGGSSKFATEKLAQAGIRIKTSLGAQLLHHKWALIDHSTLITGSTNWTKSAFAYNYDDFVIIQNLTEEQQKLMLRLWRYIDNMTVSTHNS